MMEHPYIKYAQALLIVKNQLKDEREITPSMIQKEIENGYNHFSLKVAADYKGKKEVNYIYCREKNKSPNFILAPNVITEEMKSNNIYNSARDAIEASLSEKYLNKSAEIKQMDMPIAGEFCSFKGKAVGRGKPTATEYERLLALITSLTPLKPCLRYISGTGKNMTHYNVCIIPDMSLTGLVDFIKLFERLSIQQLSDLLVEKVKVETKKDGNREYKPLSPNIYRGNFPSPPRSSALGSLALLGAIGEMTKEDETSLLAKRVVKELEDAPLYMIKYGDSSVFTFNHYILQMANKGNLRSIVDSLYFCTLYSIGPRNGETGKSKKGLIEYERFDLFASRFLQSFNSSAFHDFLSSRAEYPLELTYLFLTYFEKMEKIDPQIVHSAHALGQYLNQVAYLASVENAKPKESGNSDKADLEDSKKNNTKEQKESKAKALTVLESTIFSARTGADLIAHVIIRAGRLVGIDAPAEASLFMEKTCSGELDLEDAKNLLVAFLRIKYNSSREDEPARNPAIEENDESSDSKENYGDL